MSNHNPMNIATDFAKATGGTARKVVALTDKGPLNGFKKFLSRGSMIDMAVGVVMGSAVTAVVNSIVDNLISPLIGMIGGVPDLSGLLTITFNNSTVSFGAILNALINFLLVGVARVCSSTLGPCSSASASSWIAVKITKLINRQNHAEIHRHANKQEVNQRVKNRTK